MWRYILAAAITAVIMFAIYGPRSSSAAPSRFEWSGMVDSGQWVHVRNLNGRVRVEGTEADSVAITAVTRQGRRSRDVRIAVNESGGNLYVCPIVEGRGRCGPNGYTPGTRRGLSRIFGGRTEMHVDFTVRVPHGVSANGTTNNGTLNMSGIVGEARARTINGRIEVSDVFGPVTLQSTNGAIRARLETLPADAALSFRSTNGSITAELPEQLGADIELATTNGRIHTGYSVTTDAEISRRRFRGRIGDGGRNISMRTTNGSITMRPVSNGGGEMMTDVVNDAVNDAMAEARAAVAAAAEAAAAAGIKISVDTLSMSPRGAGSRAGRQTRVEVQVPASKTP
jgi:hypothetical protein